MESKQLNIVLPIVAGFVGLVGIVSAVTYYGSQKLNPDLHLSLSQTAASVIGNQTEPPNSPHAFNLIEYEQALSEGKAILLYFTAPWCPECDYGRIRLSQATAAWPTERVAVFVVDFASPTASSTDSISELEADLEVTAPDTKVILRDGQVLERSTEAWGLDRYREEMAEVLK